MLDPLSQFYMSNIIGLMWLQVVIFISLIFINRNHILQEFKKIDKRYFLILLAIVFFSASLYINYIGFLHPHKAYTLIAAKGFYTNNLNFFYNDGESVKAQIDTRDPYPWGPLSPFLLSVIFHILGPEPQLMHLLDFMFFSGFLVAIFLLFYILFRDEKASLLAPVIFSAMFFYVLINSNVGESPESVFFMVTTSLIFIFISLKKNTRNLYLLLMISMILTIETRVETAILMAVFIAGIFIYRKADIFKVRDFWIKRILPAFTLFLIFSPIFIVHSTSHYLSTEDKTVLGGTVNMIDFILGNHIIDPVTDSIFFINNFIYLWTDGLFLLFTSLFLIGLVFMVKKEKKICFLLILMFILHNLVFLLWNNGYHDRYAFETIIPYVIITNFSLFSITRLKKVEKYKEYIQIALFVFAFFILIFSTDFLMHASVCMPCFRIRETALNFDDTQRGLYDFSKSVEDRNVNILVFGDETLMNKIEFVTMKSTFVINHLINQYTDMYADASNVDYDPRGGMEFNASMEREKQKKSESRIYNVIEHLNTDLDLKNSLREKLLVGEVYLIDDVCSPGRYSEEMKEMVLGVFDYNIVSENECFKVYKLN